MMDFRDIGVPATQVSELKFDANRQREKITDFLGHGNPHIHPRIWSLESELSVPIFSDVRSENSIGTHAHRGSTQREPRAR